MRQRLTSIREAPLVSEKGSPMAAVETVKRKICKPRFGAPHVFVLTVVDGDATSEAFRIDRPESVIGRDEQAQVQVDDHEVSKRHSLIRVEGSVGSLWDLGSLNGTFLNGRRLPKGTGQRLRHLDEIQVGNTRFLVLTGRFRPRPRED